MPSEAELIEQLQQKQEPAFRQLVDLYKDKVFSSIFCMLQDEQEAEDASQEVFISVYESIGDFRKEASLGTWIFSIAVRKSLDKLRKRKQRQRLQQLNPFRRQVNESLHQVANPLQLTEEKEKAAVLRKAIAKLPVKQQMAFSLIRLHHMKYEEAAAYMHLSIKAIESLVSRAKVNLQQQLKQYYHSPE